MERDIVFYQQYPLPYFGISSLVSTLRSHGYYSDVVIDALEKNPLRTLVELRPELIGISVTSVEHGWLKEKVKAIRSQLPSSTIIVGGIHAILYPVEILNDIDVDIVCNSEGESVIVDVVKALHSAKPQWEGIQGISYRDKEGAIQSNERAQLYSYENHIREDSSFYYERYPELTQDRVLRFISGRGCPYHCNFCYNHTIREIFKHKGRYVRQKSPDQLIEEIKHLRASFPAKSIYFADDLFTMDKAWMKIFLTRYKEEIGLPFVCFTRADVVDDEIAGMLSSAGCHTAGFGIESGNAVIRKEVLCKDIADDKIRACAHRLKRNNIRVQTTNMFCLPDESIEDAFKTIELNISAGTDFAFSSLFMPFPRLHITDYCIERGYLKPGFSFRDIPASFMVESVLAIPDKLTIVNIQRMSFFFIRFPLAYTFFKNIVFVRWLSSLIYCIYLFGNIMRHKEERGVSFFDAFRHAWRMRKHL